MILIDDMTSQIAGNLFLNPQNSSGEMKREGARRVGKEKNKQRPPEPDDPYGIEAQK